MTCEPSRHSGLKLRGTLQQRQLQVKLCNLSHRVTVRGRGAVWGIGQIEYGANETRDVMSRRWE
jgi:hypothetical protein